MQALLAAGKDVYAGERDNAGTPATSRFRDGGERLPRTFSEPSCRHARHLAPLRREGAAGRRLLLRSAPGGSLLARWLLQRTDVLWFVAHQRYEDFASLLDHSERRELRSRAVISPMGIEPALQAADSPVHSPSRTLTITSIGRLVPVKGLHLAIEAAKGMADVRLIFAGQGPEERRLRDLARMHGVDLELPGVVKGAAKAELLRRSDMFVLPSVVLGSGRSEGTPTAMLEAMAAGLPIVASRVGGIPEFCEDGREGVLVEPGCAHALRRAFERMRERTLRFDLATGARARSQQFHWQRLAPLIDRAVRG